ncbi:hypothetical protein BS50DRAFT_637304 [Corynespora cassiicola Philippines]|uniref:BTB domain-containing protein n=1 Tax=Corynespora cassiicola Philippines TaxID=1448308 RepID=A0A2T2NEW9_CORCC|nr:hypothetical protein BS50DRAFT_637304 [Corynespora cassiicola Philippines]
MLPHRRFSSDPGACLNTTTYVPSDDFRSTDRGPDTNSQQSSKPLPLYPTDAVVYAGPELKKYCLFASQLISNSTFFFEKFNSPYNPSRKYYPVITLPEVDSGTFTAFKHSMFSQRLARWEDWDLYYPSPRTASLSGTPYRRQARILDFYIFAHDYGCKSFKQHVLKEAHGYYTETSPWYRDVKRAWEKLPSDDPLLTLLVDSQVETWPDRDEVEESPEDVEAVPKEFLWRVMRRFREVRTMGLESAIRRREEYDR